MDGKKEGRVCNWASKCIPVKYRKQQPPPPQPVHYMCGSDRPRLFNNLTGEHDVSHASLIQIDGVSLKNNDQVAYNALLHFHFISLHKCPLQMFLHPGNTCRLEGHAFVKSYTGEELEDMEAFRDTAVEAINQYNSCSKKGKLKLERLLKMNSVELHTPYLNGKTSFVDLFGPLLYMTFSATDLESGSSGFYEAAMAEHGGQHLLGLLRDRANDNILTILSISACPLLCPMQWYSAFYCGAPV